MAAYYNENDPEAAAWLRQLIKDRVIASGDVDERSITEVESGELVGYRQCHFFAGIGGWSEALRLAGWSDDRECWTGSCPCQPFSVAGKGQGADDSRDLWPAWRALIAERRPAAVFGEQVASADGDYWLDRVFSELEAQAFAVAAADLCAPGVGAPHIRQRSYFVADAGRERRQQDAGGAPGDEAAHGREPHGDHLATGARQGDCDGLADADSGHGFWWSGPLQVGWNAIEAEVERGGRRYRAQWRIKPGVSLLAHGIPGRVALLRGFGNAIVPELAAAFVAAYMDICEGS